MNTLEFRPPITHFQYINWNSHSDRFLTRQVHRSRETGHICHLFLAYGTFPTCFLHWLCRAPANCPFRIEPFDAYVAKCMIAWSYPKTPAGQQCSQDIYRTRGQGIHTRNHKTALHTGIGSVSLDTRTVHPKYQSACPSRIRI